MRGSHRSSLKITLSPYAHTNEKRYTMTNKHRGEVDAVLDGVPHTLCLTLGALAELETAFGDSDMIALAERFQSGRLSARDITRIIGAGLRGAGHPIDDSTVAQMRAPDGAAGFVAIVAQLLAATFGGPAAGAVAGAIVGATVTASTSKSARTVPEPPPLRASAEESPAPFPGPRR